MRKYTPAACLRVQTGGCSTRLASQLRLGYWATLMVHASNLSRGGRGDAPRCKGRPQCIPRGRHAPAHRSREGVRHSKEAPWPQRPPAEAAAAAGERTTACMYLQPFPQPAFFTAALHMTVLHRLCNCAGHGLGWVARFLVWLSATCCKPLWRTYCGSLITHRSHRHHSNKLLLCYRCLRHL